MSCQDGKQRIYITVSDKELLFCSTFNHISLSLVKEQQVPSVPWGGCARVSLCLLCDLPPAQLSHPSPSIPMTAGTLSDFSGLLRTLQTAQRKPWPCWQGCVLVQPPVHQEPLPSTVPCCLCTDRPGHAQLLWGHVPDTRVLDAFLHFLSQP